MGYFPLPEIKGKPNRIFVDGKTLNQIAKESGIRLDTVQHRYSRGIRDYEGFTQTEERKSIPVEWCRDHGVKIGQKKKRVRYSYDLESWLSRYFGGVK